MTIFDFTETAKDASIRVSLEIFPDYIQSAFCHRLHHDIISVVVRHTTWLNRSEKSGFVLLFDPEFFLRLTVDERRSAFFDSNLVTSFERGAKIFRLGHIFAVRAEPLGYFVVTDVFLEEMQAHRNRVAAIARPRPPGVVVVNDDDHRHPVLRGGLKFHYRVADARIACHAITGAPLYGACTLTPFCTATAAPNA